MATGTRYPQLPPAPWGTGYYDHANEAVVVRIDRREWESVRRMGLKDVKAIIGPTTGSTGIEDEERDRLAAQQRGLQGFNSGIMNADPHYAFRALDEVERDRLAMQQQLGQQGAISGGLLGMENDALRRRGLGPAFFGRYESEVKNALAAAIAPSPPFPWSRIWFYVLPALIAAGDIWSVWLFCVLVK